MNKKYFLLPVALAVSNFSFGHTINYALERAPHQEVIGYYVKLGFAHIIPDGLDHILFVIGLCLLNTKVKTILWQATAFTVAHTFTLALSMKNILVVPGTVVEPIIALSIAFIAIENILLTDLKPWRMILVFLFGLVHGMGFASALNEIGLPPDRFFLSVLSFNIGVELGQIAVIALVFALLIIPFRKKESFKKIIVYPASVFIALVAAFWTIERIFW